MRLLKCVCVCVSRFATGMLNLPALMASSAVVHSLPNLGSSCLGLRLGCVCAMHVFAAAEQEQVRRTED